MTALARFGCFALLGALLGRLWAPAAEASSCEDTFVAEGDEYDFSYQPQDPRAPSEGGVDEFPLTVYVPLIEDARVVNPIVIRRYDDGEFFQWATLVPRGR